ncbi:hypothetical protein ACFL0I_02425, partial [Gemmatimonadota bacterium]
MIRHRAMRGLLTGVVCLLGLPNCDTAPGVDAPPRVAILPFEPVVSAWPTALEEDSVPYSENLALGLHQELVDGLSLYPGAMAVTKAWRQLGEDFESTESNFELGRGILVERNPAAIANEMGGNVLLEGVVRQRADSIFFELRINDLRSGLISTREYPADEGHLLATRRQVIRDVIQILGAADSDGLEPTFQLMETPEDPHLFRRFSWARYVFGRVQYWEAIELLHPILSTEPDFARGWALQARAYAGQFYWDETQAAEYPFALADSTLLAATRAYRLDPASPFVLTALGHGLLVNGMVREGGGVFYQAAQVESDLADVHSGMAQAAYRHGCFEAAAVLAERAWTRNSTGSRWNDSRALDWFLALGAMQLYEKVSELIRDGRLGPRWIGNISSEAFDAPEDFDPTFVYPIPSPREDPP